MATAKVIIAGQNNIGSAVKGAKNDLSSFEQVAKKAGDTLKKALSVTAVVASLKKLGDACSACFDDFTTASRSYKQLSLALKDNAGYKAVVANIDKLARQTLTAKDEIESMASELAALGKSSDEINKISDAAVALSNVTGKDLNSSMTTLLNTFKGTTTQLNKLGVDTSNLTKEELENGAAVDLVIDKFYDLSEAMAEADTSQHLTNIKNTWGDIKQQIGGIVDYNIGPLIANIDGMLSDAFTNIISRINYIGAVFANLPQTAELACKTIWELVKRTFEWNTIKSLFTTVIQNITSTIQFVLENLATTIPDVVDGITSGIIYEIQYIGQNLYQELLDAIYRVFNTTEEEFKNSWLGKLLDFSNTVSAGLKGTLAIATMKPKDLLEGKSNGVTDALLKSAASDLARTSISGSDAATITDALKEGADAAFEKAGSAFKDLFSNAVAASKDNLQNTAQFFTDNYSDIIDTFKADLDNIVAPALSEIEIAADATAHNVDETTTAVENVDKTLKKGSFLDKLGDKIGSWAANITGSTSSEGSAFGGALLSSLQENLGEAGELMSDLAQNMATMGPVLGAIATALEYVFEGLAETVGPILEEFVKYGLEPLRELGRVLGDLLIPIFEDVMPLVEDVSDFLIKIFDALGVVLKPIIQVMSSSLVPIMNIISNILEALMPVLKIFAKVVVTITGTIQYVIQVLQHWVATICNWLAGLEIFGWHPFSGLRMTDPGSPGSYGAFIKDKWAQIDAAFEKTTDDASAETDTATTSTRTSISSAGYQGATQVTINIYQQAPVVGDGGMRAFAAMIKNEFDALSYYGVTA